MYYRPRHRRGNGRRTGFTLLESMMASTLLCVIVVAVLTAITAGQQNAYEAHLRIAGTLACEELMGRLTNIAYANLGTWNGHQENVGAMVDGASAPMVDMYKAVGRRVAVTTTLYTLPNGVKLNGRFVTVTAFDARNRTLASMQQFIPEPAS